MSMEKDQGSFKLICDSSGRVTGVEPPVGQTLKKSGVMYQDDAIAEEMVVERIEFLKRPGGVKICCVVSGGRLYCWC